MDAESSYEHRVIPSRELCTPLPDVHQFSNAGYSIRIEFVRSFVLVLSPWYTALQVALCLGVSRRNRGTFAKVGIRAWSCCKLA